MQSRQVYEAIVIGSGATGGWTAKELTEKGLRVIVLEAGRQLAPAAALNQFHQCRDAANVFVLNGAFFVSQGCQHPTLTMMAITVRACDYLVEQYKKGEL